MAHRHYKSPFKKALLQFITEPDPFLAMLKRVMTEMMRIEAEAKVGAAKGKHSSERATYFSGARARRVDTRMGTVYLLVPKVRKGGCVPCFVSGRSRVVGVFPSVESYVRLTICYLIEYSEDWANERSYIREDKALWSSDRLHELTAQAAN